MQVQNYSAFRRTKRTPSPVRKKKAVGIKPVCRELLGIQKTLPNVGPELLGIQEDQKDASFKNREDGGWYRAKQTVVLS